MKVVKTKEFKMGRKPILTAVIPVRNIWGTRIVNCLKSLRLQTLKFFDIIVSDYGSSDDAFKNLMKNLEPFRCTVYRCSTKAVWSLSIARNIGVRRATGKIVATIDADLILEPSVLEAVVNTHRRKPKSLVTNSVCDLNESVDLNQIEIPRDFEMLRENCEARFGVGGLMSAPRTWWFKVRGFDERMKGWGAEDDDLRKRANLDGRKHLDLQSLGLPQSRVFHQWHPKPWLVQSEQLTEEQLHKLWIKNNRIFRRVDKVLRNDKHWGIFP